MRSNCDKCVHSDFIDNGLLIESYYYCKRLNIFVAVNGQVRCPVFRKKPMVFPKKELLVADDYIVKEYEKLRVP